MTKQKDYSEYFGKRFGKLVVSDYSHKNKHGIAFVDVACDCGKSKKVRLSDLKSGRTKSCGCYKLNTYKERKLKHGGKGTDLYNVWCSMKQRCSNENSKDWPLYGGKGVRVCESWLDDFSAFRKWSSTNGYNKGLSIDRIESSGDYEPKNCRWVDTYTQANNTNRNKLYSFNGFKKTLAEWARELNIPQKNLHDRISRLGWGVDRAFTAPVRKLNRNNTTASQTAKYDRKIKTVRSVK